MEPTTVVRGTLFWPSGLAELPDPPEQLYWMGNLDLLLEPMVAIVGSRASTLYGDRVAADIAAGLARRYVVVSGGAFGIDAAAHRSAVRNEGKTVVVLPCGLDRSYPAAHRELFGKIVDCGGLLVGEYPPGTPPSRTSFLQRNRVIAALASGMVVVEAARLSGSIGAANWAKRLGRPLMAIPGPVTSALSEGCHDLIRDGAHLVRNAQDVLDALGS